ncbi:TPA: cytoplasmic protein [Bacillus cytotoxicus]|nr:cytoplasmic protein [Bacillus cytotoxicus]HDR7866119.1 cytoplasmic protein [Bacillus cytotoxicus]
MNKRIRKKQIRKQEDRFLESIGFAKKEIRSLTGQRRNKVVKNEKQKKVKRDRYQLFRSLGFNSKEANKMKSWSQSRIDRFLEEFHSKYLLIVYKDVTEETDSESLHFIKSRTKRRSSNSLVKSIKGWLELDINQGYIGGYQMQVGNKDEIAFHQYAYKQQKYLQAYLGQGIHLKPLLNILENMMVLLYTVEEKDEFVDDLVKNLRKLPYKKAHQNADYIEEEFKIDRQDLHF